MHGAKPEKRTAHTVTCAPLSAHFPCLKATERELPAKPRSHRTSFVPNSTVLYKPARQQDRRTEQEVPFFTSRILFVIKSDLLKISFKSACTLQTLINVTIFEFVHDGNDDDYDAYETREGKKNRLRILVAIL